MKKLIRLIACLTMIVGVTLGANAQFRRAALVGGSLTNLKFKQTLAKVDGVGGFQAGVQGEMMFPGIGFGIDLGFIYNMAGANVNLGDKLIWSSEGYGRERLMLHQLNLPIHLRFKWTRLNGLEDYWAPFVYGGPDFNILLAHSKCDAIQFSGGDLSLTVGLGFELWKRWQLSVQREWGMTYALKTKLLTDYSARCRQWTLRLAYFF